MWSERPPSRLLRPYPHSWSAQHLLSPEACSPRGGPLRPAVLRRCRQDGATGLVLAAQEGHEPVVRLLLRHKADPAVATQVPVQIFNRINICLLD